jgi:Domain of unknown function (DUF3291)
VSFHLAQLNVATLLAPLDDPRTADFTDNLPVINALGERSPGFVWRLTGDGNDATSLRAFPDPATIVNLTVWESVESLKAFAYRSDHVEFFKRRREWFAAEGSANVLWWVPAGHRPELAEALQRLTALRDHGPTEYAFTFATIVSPPTEPSSTPHSGSPGSASR